MTTKRALLVVLVASVVSLAVAAGPRLAETARALPPASREVAPGVTIPYPGHLTDEAGGPVIEGVYDFTFALYEAEAGGEPLWSEVQEGVPVQGGAFLATLGSVNRIPKEALGGEEQWLAVEVRGPGQADFAVLTPRQRLSAASPAALASPSAGPSCPHDHVGEVWTASIPWNLAAFKVMNYANGPSIWGWNGGGGNAIRGYATGTGVGVYGESQDSAGLMGRSTTKNGVEGYSTAPDVWAGVYGEAPHYGVFGRATTATWYGVYSDGGLGASGDLWVNGDSTFVGSKSGYVVDVAQNDDAVSLELGDVVVISGVGPAVVGEIPVIKVRLATVEGTTAVTGVVDRHFVPASAHDAGSHSPTAAPSYDDAAVAPGEYLSVVTLGSFRAIKVDASYGAIAPGDVLVASPNPGHAMRASDPEPGTILGKALEPLDAGTGVIKILVTLQ